MSKPLPPRYHQRSLMETKMHCFKLLADRVMPRDFYRQVAELQTCAAILSRFTALGTPHTVRMGLVCLGSEGVRFSAELCNKAMFAHQTLKSRNIL